jgi:glycosyltransferase involved in cell wall biosynthesis
MGWVGHLTRFSVIVATYAKERCKEVLDCINSLRQQTLPPDEIILVVDPDEELRSFYASIVPTDVAVVSSQLRGLSNARNTGVRRARADLVAFIDDDATADKDWLRNLASNYEDGQVLGVGGSVRPLWDQGRPGWFPEELDWVVGCSYKGLPENRSPVRNPIGCNMSFRRQAFIRVGYFESRLGRVGKTLLGSEEAQFSIRLLANSPSFKIIYEPSAVVYHRVPKNRQGLRHFAIRSFYEGFSKGLLDKMESSSNSVLSSERRYLKYLLRVAFVCRLKGIYDWKKFLQLIMLLLSISLVLAGYLVGGLKSPCRKETVLTGG